MRIEQAYNVVVAIVCFAVPPLCMFYAARLERLRAPIPAIAASLTLALGLGWYRWELKYGTLGFILAAGLLPLCLALTSRILSRDETLTKLQACIFVIAATLMLLWPLSGAALAPLAIWGLLALGRVLKKRRVLAAAAALLLINLLWFSVFLSTSNVGGILKMKGKRSHAAALQDSAAPQDAAVPKHPAAPSVQSAGEVHLRHRQGGVDSGQMLKSLRDLAASSNPLIVFLALPGLLLMRRESRRHFALTFLWLAFLGTAMVPIKPQLELDRMLIFLLMCACLPAALAIDRITAAAAAGYSSFYRAAAAALVIGFLLIGPLAAGAIVRNHTLEQYGFAEPIVFDMAAALRQHAGSGRVWYSGFMLHDLSGGHLAPMTYLTGAPLMASSQMHNLWWYTSALPPEFEKRAAAGGVEEYLDLYNVSAVMAHERKWQAYFGARPERYQPVWSEGHFRLYRRLDAPGSYFLEGAGRVIEQSSSALTFDVKTPQAVIKFNYFPFLTASACTLAGRRINERIEFIELRDCPLDRPVTIKARSPIARVFR